MKKGFVIFILVILCVPVSSQTVLNGRVLEYRGSDKKMPLGNVELIIQDAGSTVSSQNGNFTLYFRTKHKGDAVKVIRIERLGYEVFNTEALSQWNIGDSFTIIMCSSARFKSLRDNYFKVSSESYAKQYKAEQKRLAKRRKATKMREAEYQAQLQQLKNDYEEQLERLDAYVEHFARIDLSELSATEKEIIALVQKGKIEQAIAEYEKQNYLDKYKKQSEDIQKIDSAIVRIDNLLRFKVESRDSIFRVLNRQIDLYHQKGGEDELRKVGELLRTAAEADTTNIVVVMKYAEFSELYANKDDAIRFYDIAVMLLSEDEEMKKIIRNRIHNLEKKEDNETSE